MFELKDLDLICYVVGGSDDEEGDDGAETAHEDESRCERLNVEHGIFH